MSRFLSALMLVTFAFALGCSSDGETLGPQTIATIVVGPPAGVVVAGSTIQLEAIARDGKGQVMPLGSAVWTSSNPEVATVSGAGLVSGIVAGGPVTITVQSDGKSGTAVITVTIAQLKLTAPIGSLTALGETLQLVATALDANGASTRVPPLSWSSSDPATVEISQDGVATARRNGNAIIVARVGDLSAQAVVSVQQVATSVSVVGSPSIIRVVGLSTVLKATITDRNGANVTGQQIAWSSTNPAVATVNANGQVTATGFGSVEIRASVGQLTGRWTLEVSSEERIPIDPYLATPIAGALWEVPVVILEFLPTADGVNLDVTKNPDFYTLGEITLAALQARIIDFAKRKKMILEQGSRFHGYRDASAPPSLGYRVVEHIIVYELEPASTKRGREPGGPFHPDLNKVFARLKLAQLITEKKVREVWLVDSGMDLNYPSVNPAIHNPADFRTNWESNMSSPTTGDISNSDRDPNDLPILGHTYVVLGINFRRTQAEAAHVVGHQLEAMLSYVNQRQDGNTNLFWRQFVGQNAQNEFITGRAGWTHMPPNTTVGYDYLNRTLVPADIADWRPDASGTKTPVNVDTWGNLSYPWPGAPDFAQRVESQWYTYWMQNFPGRGSQIRYGANWMTNWWAFVADWDAAIGSGLGLYAPAPAAIAGSGSAFSRDVSALRPPWVEMSPPRTPTAPQRAYEIVPRP